MDDSGNILVRRYSKSNIYVKGTGNSSNEDTSIGSEILKSPNQCLELEKVMKVCIISFLFHDACTLNCRIFLLGF